MIEARTVIYADLIDGDPQELHAEMMVNVLPQLAEFERDLHAAGVPAATVALVMAAARAKASEHCACLVEQDRAHARVAAGLEQLQ